MIALAAALGFNGADIQAACNPCATYQPGIVWGYTPPSGLSEASGLAGSGRNPGVLWTHNDGSKGKFLAITTNGVLLATFNLTRHVDDVEDIAVGPGPASGVSYLYLGDIGGNAGTNTVRAEVKIVRVPEPSVKLSWADSPKTPDFNNVNSFTLVYPDGSYDAETLLVDPLTQDVFVVTKQAGSARVYRANITTAADKSSLPLEFVRVIPFSLASGGDISADGTQVAIRREDTAMAWGRCLNETVGTALGRTGTTIPVVGPPDEPNGEALAFLRDGTGYMTVSEGVGQPLYFFQSLCPSVPRMSLALSNQSGFVGGSAQFRGVAVGYPSPAIQWLHNNQILAGQTDDTLALSDLTFADAGEYLFIASNSSGSVTNNATLTIRLKPDLRITEVQSAQAPSPGVPTADWWELTSFESQPITLTNWKFNDSDGGLTDPYVFTQPLSIASGESIIFVENLTKTQFRTWWGTSNLPVGLQIVPYSGLGLSLGATGDGLRLWDSTTSDPNSPVAQVDFGPADAGVSFNYDPVTEQFGANSQLGVNGVIQAASATDIGSPGRIIAMATSPVITATRSGENLIIEFDASFGRVYTLEVSEDLDQWSPSADPLQPDNNMRAWYQFESSASARFFRVRVE